MNILVVGSGGREHALVWKIRQGARVNDIFCAPGNAGIEDQAQCVSIKPTDIPSLLKFAKTHGVDLTVVGPEQPLTEGIVDQFEQEGLKIFGPSRAAAELEGSKVFAKHFMKKYDIPTARFGTFDRSRYDEAKRFIAGLNAPIVVKADGLAAGKGVVICETQGEAVQTVDAMMEKKMFGPASERVVVEEYLPGEEMSVLAITDGKNSVILPTAQDHKRILDGDKGRNTGGMGAYAPAPPGTPRLMGEIRRKIIQLTIDGMANEGKPYKGCLYIGLMLTKTGPKVLEYNCRFGDPEAQAVLPLIENDIIELFLAAISGELQKIRLKQRAASTVCVVIASAGYPDAYEVGKTITGLDAQMETDVIVFHAGTRRADNQILTAGGRVVGVTATGPEANLAETIDKAYRTVRKITFDGAYYRSDIGEKGLRRLKEIAN